VTGVDWWQLPGAAPLHATRRTPELRTEGARVAIVAQALGTPLMPWQRYVADVAGELNPDGSYRWPVVVVSVPRQSGKTTLMRAVGTDRALSRDGTGVFYTAQTGKDARERWQDLVAAIKESPLAPLATVRRAAGSERVVFANGSMFRCFAPVAKSLHGYTPPLVMLDEAFAHDQRAGDDLMGAIGPAQVTIPHRQLWIVSTMGTAESTFLHGWIDAGRAGAPDVALFEWAAGPEVADIYDPQVWPTFHPAMVPGPTGRPLVTADAIASEAARLPRSEFERAYGNRRTRTASHLIPPEVWDALGAGQPGHPEQSQPTDPQAVVFAWDVMEDRSAYALVATWHDGHQLQAKVAKSDRGTAGLTDAVLQLHAAGWRRFAAAEDGPAREVTDELRRLVPGIDITTPNGRQLADAWGFTMRRITDRTLTHDGSEAFATAAANIATRPVGDTSAPSRRNSAGDVTPMLGLLVSSWVLDHGIPDAGLQYRFAG